MSHALVMLLHQGLGVSPPQWWSDPGSSLAPTELWAPVAWTGHSGLGCPMFGHQDPGLIWESSLGQEHHGAMSQSHWRKNEPFHPQGLWRLTKNWYMVTLTKRGPNNYTIIYSLKPIWCQKNSCDQLTLKTHTAQLGCNLRFAPAHAQHANSESWHDNSGPI